MDVRRSVEERESDEILFLNFKHNWKVLLGKNEGYINREVKEKTRTRAKNTFRLFNH